MLTETFVALKRAHMHRLLSLPGPTNSENRSSGAQKFSVNLNTETHDADIGETFGERIV